MKILESLYGKVVGILGQIRWFPPLLARVTIGAVFIESGWGKLHNLTKVIDYFQSLGIPFAQYQAPFVSGMEFCAGILIFIGLATRIASIPLSIIMVMAVVTAKSADLTTWTDLFSFAEFLYIVLLVWLLFEGAGSFSIDRLIANRRRFKK